MKYKLIAQVSNPGAQTHISLSAEIGSAVFDAVQSLFPGSDLPKPVVSIPQATHGDFCVGLFQAAKALGQNVNSVATQVAETLAANAQVSDRFRVTVGGAYVNFRLRDQVVLEEVARIGPDFGRNSTMAGKRILVEFVSANPTGPLHIGHGRWAVLGDSICRLFEACGAIVTREFYINDAGAQIQRFRDSVDAVRQGRPVPEGGYQGDYIADLAKSGDDPVQAMIEHHRRTLESLGVRFDNWFSEKTLHEGGPLEQAMRDLEALGYTYKATARPQDEADEPNAAGGVGGEATWFRTTDFGDDKDRVLTRSDGRPTYLAADVAYHWDKVRRGYDLLINIFGADHHGYVARISAAIQAASDRKQVHEILIGQLVKLKGERMSKRRGTVVMLHDLIAEIGADAVRVFMGRTGFNQSLSIDLDLAVSQSKENPVYYFQYAHARISQLLVKARERGVALAETLPPDYNLNPEERRLLVYMLRFPDLVESAARRRDVSKLQEYTAELAALFHRFYHAHQVVDPSNLEQSGVRLLFALKTQQLLKNAFALLGISAPEKMEPLSEVPEPEGGAAA